MSSKPEIFFSYAWGDPKEDGESREKIVNELYESLKADGYNVVMDKHDVGYKGMITDFMRRIGRGQFVVVAISDKYLKSEYCMYELLEIYRKSNSDEDEMLAKIFPIVLKDANIYNAEDAIDYIKHWENQVKSLNKKLKEVNLANATPQIKNLRLRNEIATNIGTLSDLINSINNRSPQLLSAKNFAIIKQAINERIAQPQTTSSHAEAPNTIYNTIHLTAPPFLSEVFLDRDEDLKNIHTKLTAGNLLLLVNGQGGIGKTSIAAHYYHRYGQYYTHTAWAFREKSITNALLLLATPLGIRFEDSITEDERIEILLNKMASLSRPCLLVIDNANDLDDLQDNYISLRRCANFHLLLTTRITKFANATIYPVKALSDEKALELFTEYYTEHNREEDALFKQVYDAVGHNTLVIELLAKNLAILNEVHTQYSLTQLVADLQKGLLTISQTKPVYTHYHADTLLKGEPLDIIEAMYDLNELLADEKRILSIMAVLPAENISFATLQTLLPATTTLPDTLALLSRKGWLEHNRIEGNFKISPVIQEIARKKNLDLLQDCSELISSLTDKLAYDGQHLTGCSYADAPIYIRYGESVVGQFKLNSAIFDLLLERLGSCHGILGNLPKALYFYQQDAQLCQTLCETNPENENFRNDLAIAYDRLGDTYADMGNLPEALRLYKDYNILRQQLCEAYPDNVNFKNGLAISYSKLGQTYAAMGKLPEALRFYEQRSKLGKELYEAYPDNVGFKNGLAISYSKLGETYADMGKLPEALGVYEQQANLAKELYEAYPGNVNFKNGLAISYEKLGQTNADMGKLPEALGFYEQQANLAKELYEAYPDNVNFKNGLAISYSKLGQTYAAMGKLPEALRFFEESSRLGKELYKAYPDNVNFKNGLAISYSKLGETYTDMGNLPEALGFYEDYHGLRKELYEAYPDNVNFKNGLAISYERLGQTYADMGNLQEALGFYEQQSNLAKELYEAYPDNVNFKNGLAVAYQWLGWFYENKMNDIPKAMEYYRLSKPLLVELTNSFPDYLQFTKNLAWVNNKLP